MDKTGRDGDTVKLLRECDAGIKMGISSINDVVRDVRDSEFKSLLKDSRRQHEKLGVEVGEQLSSHNESGKPVNPIAKSMSFIKSNAKYFASPTDATIADLMTDGCNMGVKSLSRYINQYQSADASAKRIAERLVDVELQLTEDIRQYL